MFKFIKSRLITGMRLLTAPYRRTPQSFRIRVRRAIMRLPKRILRPLLSQYGSVVQDEFVLLTPAPSPVNPSEAEWMQAITAAHARKSNVGTPVVDVIVPVYKGFDETLACIYSLFMDSCKTSYELIAIDDCSPDDDLSRKLRELAYTGAVTVLRNDTNLGFVKTVNLGMSLHPDRDVLLLNSDTEVYGDWLDRIRANAYQDEKIATVTPFTSNGTICSYPFFMRDNGMDIGDYGTIDRLASAVNYGIQIDLPTAVGFCMYIKRSVLDECGLFDAEAFGKGYGEENDFCCRVASKGYRNTLATDTFVRHVGSTSFGTYQSKAGPHALNVLRQRYPGYEQQVNRHITRDPASFARRKLDVARIAAAIQNRPCILFVSHNRGGGIERHLNDLAQLLSKNGFSVIYMRPADIGEHLVTLSCPEVVATPNLIFNLLDRKELEYSLTKLNIKLIHVHQWADYTTDFTDIIEDVSRGLEIPYDVTIHDYIAICPRVNLIGTTGSYCGEPDANACNRCIKASDIEVNVTSIESWRDRNHAFLRSARQVLVPDEDVKSRIVRYYPDLNIVVRPHFIQTDPVGPIAASRQKQEPLRVAILGAVGVHKGYNVILQCARDAKKRKLPIQYVIVGYTSDDIRLYKYGCVKVTGKYDEADIAKIVAEQQCHLAWFSSVWPETYSYTLSHALQLGLYPISFDLGAIARRIHEIGWGETIPLSRLCDPSAINDHLLSVHITQRPSDLKLPTSSALYENFLRDYYGLEIGAPSSIHDTGAVISMQANSQLSAVRGDNSLTD